ncbi:hypothetical protein AVEN_253073-1 [Araneus ventricosus]|uniref:Uncharacterized protein n=1 Tax=Araneus ventricosus TaxID=182803 RepID=A0A4Y2MIF1_ARAVE|nr:hypothetical protein AVEN_253073-1 [Araneus ventricosus]
MTYIRHTISLHNLPVSADICRNVALIVRCPDDRKSFLDPVGSLEQLPQPGHRWNIVFHSMFYELEEHVKVAGRTANGYSQILCSMCDAHSAIADNNVFHLLHHV